MGIREHFEEQADKKEVKLSDLNMDQEKGRDNYFDISDVTEEDWENIEKMVRGERRSFDKIVQDQWVTLGELAVNLRSNMWERDVDFSDDDEFFKMLEMVGNRFDRTLPSEHIRFLTFIKFLFPDKEGFKRDFGFATDTVWKRNCRDIMKSKHFNDSEDFRHDLAANMKILFPKKFEALDFEKNEKYVQHIKEGMDRIKAISSVDEIYKFSRKVKRLKILFPEDAGQFKMDKEEQKRISEMIGDAKQDNRWYDFVKLVEAYCNLIADGIGIGEKGFEYKILDANSFKQKKKKRPERKSF